MQTSSLETSHRQPALPNCLAELIDTLEQGYDFGASDAAKMLSRLEITEDDLAYWHDFSHPAADSYGRLLIQGGANYELMVMSWLPGDYSAIHDHGKAEWGAVRYFGNADHVIFCESDDKLSIQQRMTMSEGDVFAVEPSLIHLMGNPTDQPFISLHLYGRNQADDSITGNARIFDVFEDRIQRTDGGVFFCLPEQDIHSREACPVADAETRLLHHQLMLARINRMLQAGTSDTTLAMRAARLRNRIKQLHDVSSMELPV
jgi:predicted metal-dependent enzyme (double-stranded beta helix superfamily)